MNVTQTFIDIDKAALLTEVNKMKSGGRRLAQICASVPKGAEGFVLLYSFIKDDNLTSLRVNLPKTEQVESISRLFSFAFLYENEMKDLFGVNISDMTLDFNGSLYKTAVKAPFGAANVGGEGGGANG